MPQWIRRLGLIALAVFKVALALAIGFGLLGVCVNAYAGGAPTAALPVATNLDLKTSVWIFSIAVALRLILSRFALSLLLATVERSSWRRSGLTVAPLASEEFIQRAFDTYFMRFPDTATLKLLIGHLVDPAGFIDRITERADLLPATQERIIKFNYRRPSTSTVVLVPLLEQTKGALVDELDVSVDGSSAITLPFLENQGAMLAAVLALFDRAVGNSTHDDVVHARASVSKLVASSAPVSPEPVLNEILLAVHQNGIQDEVALEALQRLVRVCGPNFFILTLLEPSERERTKIEVSTRLSTGLGHRRFLDAPRVALGLRPREYSFQLRRAGGTPTFHFSMRTPRGTYIFDRWFEASSFSEATSRKYVSGARAGDYLISPSTKYLHAYLRNAPNDPTVIPSVRVQLRERPPGLVEVAAGLSILLFLSVWFVGRFHDIVFPLVADSASKTGSPPSSAWTTILFGVPTLLVGWLITRIDGNSLARTSIRSLGMVGWLAVNSFAAVLAAGFKTSGAELTPETPYYWPPFTVAHPVWAIVMMSCVMHLALSFVFVFARALRYTLAVTGLTYRYGRSGIRSGSN